MRPYNKSINRVKTPDLEKEYSEKILSTEEFLVVYNADLPKTFPHISLRLLIEFKKTYPSLFKNQQHWTLGQHRKKVMDWLPQRIDSVQK